MSKEGVADTSGLTWTEATYLRPRSTLLGIRADARAAAKPWYYPPVGDIVVGLPDALKLITRAYEAGAKRGIALSVTDAEGLITPDEATELARLAGNAR